MRKGLLTLVSLLSLSAAAIPAHAIQCVPFAREMSGIDLQGDAWKWWTAAAGRYDRGRTPQADAVLVFSRQGNMRYGHVSVVSKVVNSRMILVDHANWAPASSSGRGEITRLVPVLDVSPGNDWSTVRVWYEPASSFGGKVYRAEGFVYNPSRRAVKVAAQKSLPARVAPAEPETIRPSVSPAATPPVVAASVVQASAAVPPVPATAAPKGPARADVLASAEAAAPMVAALQPVGEHLERAIAVAKVSFGRRDAKPEFFN